MRSYEPQGGVGEADAVPENPLAQNAATEALKPKPRVPVVGALAGDPNAPALPSAAPSTATPATNPDPNAYSPPPQAAMPAAGPISTLSGDWTPPTAAPDSAPLIASAAGGTMTPQGTAQNPFAGYKTVQGGGFGGYDSVPLIGDPLGRTFKQYDQDFIKNANALKQVPPLSQAEIQAMWAADSGANAVKDKIANGQPVTDKELAFVRHARYLELEQDTAAPTFGTFGTKAGTATAADPAKQAAGLASQGLPQAGPSGAPPAPPPTAPSVSPSAAPPVPPPAAPPGPDAGTGTWGTPQPPGPPSVPGVGVLNGAPAAGMASVAQTAVTPQNALTNSMLARAPGADRFKIAQDQYKAAEEASAPQYEADLRQAMRKAAAGGALGSGMLQTSIGDIAQNRDIFNRTNRTNLLSDALKGTIGDQFGDVGIAQQQQGFQQGQQQQAFGNEVTQATLQEALKSGDFNRALQMLTAGSSNNPSDTALALSQIFGGQASSAGASLAALLGGMGQKNATPTPTATAPQLPAGLTDWLKNYAGSLGTGGVF